MGKRNIMVILNGKLKDGTVFNNTRATLVPGKYLSEPPKTYKELGVLSHNLGSTHSSYLLTVYKAVDNTYRYSRYIDGSFYEQFGKIIF